MESPSKPIPIVLCGKAEVVAKPVIEGLKPEYEVILFCLGAQATAAEVPYILRGIPPPSPTSALGTGNYTTAPAAIIMGSAWDADDAASVQAAIRSIPPKPNSESTTPVILRYNPDVSVSAPAPPSPEYAFQLVRRIRMCLDKLTREQEGPESGVMWY